MKNVSKLYKTQLNKSYCEYQDKTANIIREKSRTDPKGLWKILNNIDKKKSDVGNNVTDIGTVCWIFQEFEWIARE